jgi:hypothetical protein
LPNFVIGREKSRETEGGGKEGHTLTEYMETKLDAKLKDAFTSSFKTGNTSFIAWAVFDVYHACLSYALDGD